jgi:hypothetical protein
VRFWGWFDRTKVGRMATWIARLWPCELAGSDVLGDNGPVYLCSHRLHPIVSETDFLLLLLLFSGRFLIFEEPLAALLACWSSLELLGGSFWAWRHPSFCFCCGAHVWCPWYGFLLGLTAVFGAVQLDRVVLQWIL